MKKVNEDVFKCKLMLGDSKDILKQFPDNIFHTAVTSPPYWNQRDYRVKEQLGQEATPEEYIENLVDILREVKRVLRNDGTLWLNIGDTFCKKNIKSSNLKIGDLVGIPWMLAFALRKDGWYLKSDIIWKKTNPMPESQRIRPSKSHEYLFLLAKSKKYFYDAEAIAEPQKEISIKRAFSKNSVDERKDANSDEYAISGKSQDKTYEKLRKRIKNGEKITCNKKDVWELATANNKIKHFAMFPDKLAEPCILAGSSSGGCCAKCRTPLVRKDRKEIWEFNCVCKETKTKECLILDPFNGSGTTGRVCKALNRKYIGIDVSQEYIDYARKSLMADEDIFSTETEVDTIEELIDL